VLLRLRSRLHCSTTVADTWFAVSMSAFLGVLLHWDMADIRLLWFAFGMLSAQSLYTIRLHARGRRAAPPGRHPPPRAPARGPLSVPSPAITRATP